VYIYIYTCWLFLKDNAECRDSVTQKAEKRRDEMQHLHTDSVDGSIHIYGRDDGLDDLLLSLEGSVLDDLSGIDIIVLVITHTTV